MKITRVIELARVPYGDLDVGDAYKFGIGGQVYKFRDEFANEGAPV